MTEKIIRKDGHEACIYCVLELMELQGGDFVRLLSRLWWQADPVNKNLIEKTWQHYFVDYAARVTPLTNMGECEHDFAT